MAITILTPPRSPALSNDDNYVVMQTNLPTATARPGFLVAGISADGDELNLRWGDTIVRMTFAATPDNSGLQLRATNGQTEADYMAQLTEALYSIPAIEAAFQIEHRTDGVRLTLRGALTGSLLATSTGVTVTIFGSDTGTQHPNLSAFMSVYKVGQTSPIGRFKAHYDQVGGTDFNLGQLLNLEVGLPDTASLGSNPTYAVTQPEGFAEYFFRYADQYGSPPQPETLTKSATFSVVAGGSGGASRFRWGGSAVLCHAYFNRLDGFFTKPITYDQPDYAYLYLDAAANVGAIVEVFYDDGTSENRLVAAVAARAKGLHCFPSGPRQCGLDQLPSWNAKNALRYSFVFSNGPVVVYEFEPVSPEWETILAYDNGVGGIETVGFRGKSERGYSVEKQQFRRARTRVRRSDQGEVVNYNVEGRTEQRLRSGYYSQDYIEHLAQLLTGRVWVVDQLLRRFVAVNVTTSSLRLSTNDDQLHALEISITSAARDRAAHNL